MVSKKKKSRVKLVKKETVDEEKPLSEQVPKREENVDAKSNEFPSLEKSKEPEKQERKISKKPRQIAREASTEKEIIHLKTHKFERIPYDEEVNSFIAY